MRRLAVFMVTGVLTVPAVIGTVPAEAAGYTPNAQVSTTPGVNVVSAIGGDGTAAVVFDDDANQSWLAVHRPGHSWDARVVGDLGVMSNHPIVTVSGNGQVDVVWEASSPSPGYVMTRSIAPDGTVGDSLPLSNNDNTPLQATIAGNAAGDVAAAWIEYFDGSNRVFTRFRPHGSSTWSAETPISNLTSGASYNAQLPALALTPTGDVVAAWTEQAGGSTYQVQMRRRPASTGIWSTSPTMPATTPSNNPLSLAVDDLGNAIAAYKDTAGTPHVHGTYLSAADVATDEDLGAGFDTAATFRATGDPVVAKLSGAAASNADLSFSERLAAGTWDSWSPWVGAELSTLGLMGDGQGLVLATLCEHSACAPKTIGFSGPARTPIAVADVPGPTPTWVLGKPAMNSWGDAVIPMPSAPAPDGRVFATGYDVTGPRTIAGPLPTWSLTSASLAWSVSDAWSTSWTSTVSRALAGASTGFGPWTDVASTTGASAVVSVPTGVTACFRVRAAVPVANTGAWSATQCTAAPVDDRSLSGRATWRKLTGSAYYGRTALSAKAKGRTLSFRATALRLALVAKRCGTCGSVKVLVNGVLVRRISLKGAARNQVVYPIATYPSARGVKVRIVTRSARKVIVDGLGVSRS
jgi:hypothetical protein